MNMCSVSFKTLFQDRLYEWLMRPVCLEMPAPLSNDFRWRIIWLVFGLQKTSEETSRLLQVTQRTVFNVLRRFRRYGNVRPSRIGRPNIMSSITRGEAFMLMEYVMRYPGAYLREAIEHIERICGREFSTSSVWRCLQRHNITRRKLRRFVVRMRRELVEQFMQNISIFTSEEMVFIDEAGFDRRLVRNYGRVPRGWRIQAPKAASWGPRISAIIVASQQGIQLCPTTKQTINGERFLSFVRNQLVPILQPYNGQNPNSIVIMDNHPVHHLNEVRRLITRTGALLRFLPPYCPDLNPVEMVIANAKARIREQEFLFARLRRPQGLVLLSILQVSRELCEAFVAHCGY
ncbi:uncharacterized protein LOC144663179 [Oculina patagonica]